MSDVDRADGPMAGNSARPDEAAPEEPPTGVASSLRPPPAARAGSAPKPAVPRAAWPLNRAIVSNRSRRFLWKPYPGISIDGWNDWCWQLRVRRLDTPEKIIELTADERLSVERRTGNPGGGRTAGARRKAPGGADPT